MALDWTGFSAPPPPQLRPTEHTGAYRVRCASLWFSATSFCYSTLAFKLPSLDTLGYVSFLLTITLTNIVNKCSYRIWTLYVCTVVFFWCYLFHISVHNKSCVLSWIIGNCCLYSEHALANLFLCLACCWDALFPPVLQLLVCGSRHGTFCNAPHSKPALLFLGQEAQQFVCLRASRNRCLFGKKKLKLNTAGSPGEIYL